MKRFTFMLVAALAAVMSYAQVPFGATSVDREVEDNAQIEQNTYKFDFLKDENLALGELENGVIFEEGFLSVTSTNAVDEEGEEVKNKIDNHGNQKMFFLYAGSQLTFAVPYGSEIEEIIFDFSQWGVDNSGVEPFSTGTYSNTGNGKQTWKPAEGESVREVTLTAQGVVSRFYSITVKVKSEKAVEPTEEVIEAAADYNIDAIYYYWGNRRFNPVHIQKTIKLSYDEEGFVYLQGLAYYDEDAWVKGIADTENNTITIKPQVWYEDEYGVTYFVGFNSDDTEVQDVVINLVENEDGTVTLKLDNSQKVAENDGQKDYFDAWGYYGTMTINEGEFVHPEPIEVPEDLETAEFILDGQYIYQSPWGNSAYAVRRPLQVGVDEDGVIYIQGLSYFLPEAWVAAEPTEFDEEGNATQITVPACQFLGYLEEEYQGETYEYEFYLNDNSWYELGDIVLDVDPETKTLTTENYLHVNCFNQTYELYLVDDVTPYIVPDAVELPEGLVVNEFYATADGEDAGLKNVAIDMENKKVYVQGICETLPEAWIVGDIDEDNEVITFAANQFLGKDEDDEDVWLNFHGDDYEFAYDYDELFGLDAPNNAELATDILWVAEGLETLLFNTKELDEFFYIDDEVEEYDESYLLERVQTLVPDMPEISAVNAIMVGEGIVEITFNVPNQMTYENALGEQEVVEIDADQMSYEFFFQKDEEWEPIVFSPEPYGGLTEEQSEFALTDVFQGIQHGKVIIKDNVVGDWTKIGLKSYNRVPGTSTWRESEMAEVVLKNIATGIQEIAANENVSYTDMQGRQAKASAKGLLIKQVRSNDGSVKTVKVVRK